jgi:uncharacterized cupin superfamily protein
MIMPKVDLETLPQTNATGYPPPFDAPVAGRWYRRLAPAFGIDDFAASHVVLKPGAWSSQRHWHDDEDEMLIMISGEAVLVEDDGETLLRAGDLAVWPKGIRNGHHLRNDSAADCVFVVIGGGPNRHRVGSPAGGGYSDIDMLFTGDGRYTRKDGSPYPAKRVP